MPFKHRMHPDLMLARFLDCRRCKRPLVTCQAEPDQEPPLHWQLYAMLNGFRLEPPFESLTVQFAGGVWPVRVLFVLYHQVVCMYTFHGKDRFDLLWEGHSDGPQENPLGEHSTCRRDSISKIALLGWFLEGWPWRVHRLLRHVAYSTHLVGFGEGDWVSEVIKTFTLGHDPIRKFHLGYMQETLDRDRNIEHEDFLDHTQRVFVQPCFQRLMTSLRLWDLEELPVLNVEDCACARRWKEVGFLASSRD
ncbi:hypothetical protein [Deinococcus cellulosilyticus]|uniref:Uncharacterized protein n=1 Tax=Deinococcus cellulosilyticus (strain DSM 18568 / NBRC 106333 / KACC 11606 / 5516J-15) TaxID=1223518 RepID=A0A511MYJ3_DEIC1|nr:hypothetical protein [Deinococcus cellulosilyticus]GEM45643.1 hypothetical protein DC3_12780 [Deinococcus cellulosilyticus NBRC 106333 = KACC 11606]